METRIDVAPDVGLEAFFEDHLPAKVQQLLRAHPADALRGQTVQLGFEVAGEPAWGLTIRDGSDVTVARAPERCDLRLGFDEAGFRRIMTGPGRRLDIVSLIFRNRHQLHELDRVQGQVDIRAVEDGQVWPLGITFRDNTTRQVKIRSEYERFCDLFEGRASGVQLFLTGRLKAKGDMALLMAVQRFL